MLYLHHPGATGSCGVALILSAITLTLARFHRTTCSHSPGTPCQHKLVGAHITPTATNMSIASIEIAPDESCGSTRMRRSQVRAGRRVSERPEGLRGRAGLLVGGAAIAVEMLVCLGRVVVMVVVVMGIVDGKVMTSLLDSVLRREKSTCLS